MKQAMDVALRRCAKDPKSRCDSFASKRGEDQVVSELQRDAPVAPVKRVRDYPAFLREERGSIAIQECAPPTDVPLKSSAQRQHHARVGRRFFSAALAAACVAANVSYLNGCRCVDPSGGHHVRANTIIAAMFEKRGV